MRNKFLLFITPSSPSYSVLVAQTKTLTPSPSNFSLSIPYTKEKKNLSFNTAKIFVDNFTENILVIKIFVEGEHVEQAWGGKLFYQLGSQ